jgi:hypothetical protein
MLVSQASNGQILNGSIRIFFLLANTWTINLLLQARGYCFLAFAALTCTLLGKRGRGQHLPSYKSNSRKTHQLAKKLVQARRQSFGRGRKSFRYWRCVEDIICAPMSQGRSKKCTESGWNLSIYAEDSHDTSKSPGGKRRRTPAIPLRASCRIRNNFEDILSLEMMSSFRETRYFADVCSAARVVLWRRPERITYG